MYDLLYDFIGFDAESELANPELYSIFIAGMSCVMIGVILYLILYFFISVFRGTK